VQVSGDPGQLFVVATSPEAAEIMFAPFDQAAAADSSCAYPPVSAAFASGACWPAELGAQEICSHGDSPKKSFSELVQVSAPAAVPIVAALSRRCSYEEVVHADMEQDAEPATEHRPFENMSVQLCLQTATQWAVTLRDVADDRGGMGLLAAARCDAGSRNCVCKKASVIVQQLEALEKCFVGALEEDAGLQELQRLWEALAGLQELLRMNVSIQVVTL
jgi:hypothetical protein